MKVSVHNINLRGLCFLCKLVIGQKMGKKNCSSRSGKLGMEFYFKSGKIDIFEESGKIEMILQGY